MQGKVGALNWQPENHSDDETGITIEAKRIHLININSALQLRTVQQADVDEKIKSNLTASFKTIREFVFNDFENQPTPHTLHLS